MAKGFLKKNMYLFRAFVTLAVIIYVLGVVPQFADAINELFANPLVKIVFLFVVVTGGYLDTTIGALLALAFVVSYLVTPGSFLYNLFQGLKGGAQDVVGGVGSGTQRLVSGVGSSAQQLIGGVGSGAHQVVGGVQRGAQELVGGVGAGTQQLLGGAGQVVGRLGEGARQALGGAGTIVGGLGEGAQQALSGAGQLVGGIEGSANQLLGGVGAGTQQFLTGLQSGAQQLVGGASEGTQQLVGGFQRGTQQLIGNIENLHNAPMSVSDAYQQHAYSESQGDKGCSVQPQMGTGCDPVVGYNAPFSCDDNSDCLCTGVQTMSNQMTTQGFNDPQGYSGCQVGASY